VCEGRFFPSLVLISDVGGAVSPAWRSPLDQGPGKAAAASFSWRNECLYIFESNFFFCADPVRADLLFFFF